MKLPNCVRKTFPKLKPATMDLHLRMLDAHKVAVEFTLRSEIQTYTCTVTAIHGGKAVSYMSSSMSKFTAFVLALKQFTLAFPWCAPV